METLTELDKKLLNDYQNDFPLSAKPFLDIARQCGVDEETVIDRLNVLQNEGLISRVGPVFKVNGIGVSTLAAMSVPEEQLTEIADLISSYEEVNHNYEREHEYNLWFVITADNEAQLDHIIKDINLQTNIKVLKLPMLDDYHINLGFELQWN